MPIHDHEPSFQGKAFLWGGIGLGVLFLAALLTHGFGLLSGRGKGEEPPALMVRQGDKIVVPEGSALRKALTVEPAAARPVNAQAGAAGGRRIRSRAHRGGADAARRAGGLRSRSPWAIGSSKGQVLAVIDSPDLGQAYDDDAKAADAFKLADKNSRAPGRVSTRSARPPTRTWTRRKATTPRRGRIHPHAGAPENARRASAEQITSSGRWPPPMSGSITALSVAPGNMINDPTQPLMTIADLSTVWVTALVPEKDVSGRPQGPGRRSHADRLSGQGAARQGAVRLRRDRADSRRNKLRIAFANGDYAAQAEHVRDRHRDGPAIAPRSWCRARRCS